MPGLGWRVALVLQDEPDNARRSLFTEDDTVAKKKAAKKAPAKKGAKKAAKKAAKKKK
jgi:hypothetical protein